MIKYCEKKIILIGCGGHTKVCADVVLNSGKFQIAGVVCDEKKCSQSSKYWYRQRFKNIKKKYNYALITIGQIKNYQKRLSILNKLKKLDFRIPVIISKQAITSKSAKIKSGTIVMDRAVIHQDVNIGENCTINTGAIIEHDVTIGNNSHISTGAIVNGGVKIGNNVFIGSGSIIVNNINIKSNSFVKAGSLVKHI